jgi:hypothetical protein
MALMSGTSVPGEERNQEKMKWKVTSHIAASYPGDASVSLQLPQYNLRVFAVCLIMDYNTAKTFDVPLTLPLSPHISSLSQPWWSAELLVDQVSVTGTV